MLPTSSAAGKRVVGQRLAETRGYQRSRSVARTSVQLAFGLELGAFCQPASGAEHSSLAE